jgi:hypothetical protein
MHIFAIDAENHVTAYAATGQLHLPSSGYRFANAGELSRLAASWPATRMVEIWNKLPNVKAVQKFTDRRTAVRRIWRAVQTLAPSPTEQHRTVAPTRSRAPTKSGPSVRDGTKKERIIALLKRPSGATLKDMMAETGWQPHSVRGFISAQLSKRLGLQIKSFKRRGERVYRIHSQATKGEA